jgi:hypothetical protein
VFELDSKACLKLSKKEVGADECFSCFYGEHTSTVEERSGGGEVPQLSKNEVGEDKSIKNSIYI